MKLHSFLRLLILSNVCLLSLASAGSDFNFSPVWDQVKFSQRKVSAELSTESEESLKKNGYVYIGLLDNSVRLETCWGEDCDKSLTCPDILKESISIDQAARKAASYGGDKIILVANYLVKVDVSKDGRKCIEHQKMPILHSKDAYDITGKRIGSTSYMVWEDRCIKWEQIPGKACKIYRKVGVWRKQDAELTNLLKRDEMIDNYIKAGRDNSSKLKPKSEAEFKVFIAKFEESEKYHAMKKWHEYNYQLWKTNHDLKATLKSDTMYYGLRRFEGDLFGKIFYGYMDINEKIIIGAHFYKAEEFSDGLACVSTGDKYGFIDTNGMWAIAPVYDYCEGGMFISGVAHVDDKDGHGYLDKTGKLYLAYRIIEPAKLPDKQFESAEERAATPFLSESYQLKDDSAFYKSLESMEEAKKYDAMEERRNKSYDLYLLSTEWDDTIKLIWAHIDKNGRAASIFEDNSTVNKKGCRCGYKDNHGNIVVEPQFYACKRFSNGFAAVCKSEGEMWGYINKSGEWVIQPIFIVASDFYGGVGSGVTAKGKTYINKSGKTYMK